MKRVPRRFRIKNSEATIIKDSFMGLFLVGYAFALFIGGIGSIFYP